MGDFEAKKSCSLSECFVRMASWFGVLLASENIAREGGFRAKKWTGELAVERGKWRKHNQNRNQNTHRNTETLFSFFDNFSLTAFVCARRIKKKIVRQDM